MRFLPVFIVISSCGLSTEHKHKVHYWDVDYYNDESTILVDTSYNSDSQHKLDKIYLAESLFIDWWNNLAQHEKIENDTFEIKILNKGSVHVNGKNELVYKILTYEKTRWPFRINPYLQP